MNATNDSYYKLDSARITELRKIADTLNTTDMLALATLWGLRNIQEMNIDMVSGGDATPDQIDQSREGMALMAAEMTCDMITPEDMRAVARVNDLGDYSVKFITKVVGVRKSV